VLLPRALLLFRATPKRHGLGPRVARDAAEPALKMAVTLDTQGHLTAHLAPSLGVIPLRYGDARRYRALRPWCVAVGNLQRRALLFSDRFSRDGD
jgi:hypothetical protein